MVHLIIQNQSGIKRLYNTTTLRALAETVCRGEGLQSDAEISLLLCDDPFIQTLNHKYRNKNTPTDVLSFEQGNTPGQEGPCILGDIVISLETIQCRCQEQRSAMVEELKLLFCHGLLHLLGHDHATNKTKAQMQQLQARYLGCTSEAAWIADKAS